MVTFGLKKYFSVRNSPLPSSSSRNERRLSIMARITTLPYPAITAGRLSVHSRKPDVRTTQISENGRKIFQPSRIN